MRKVKIILPAAITNMGPGIGTLGLALSLHTTVEISERSDNRLVVDTEGEGAGHYSIGLRHPVVLALIRVFQKLERAPPGIHIRISNHIPMSSGLGAEAAFLVAGVIGANNLLGNTFSRTQILEIAAQISDHPTGVLTTLLGGLTTGILDGDTLLYRTLPVSSMKVVVVLPDLEGYSAKKHSLIPERILLSDALFNLNRIPLLVEGLRSGDLKLINRVLGDKLQTPYLSPHIPIYQHVTELARRAGAAAITLSGEGPALVAFAENNHTLLGEIIVTAFANTGVKARSWVLPIDQQGVIISAAQST